MRKKQLSFKDRIKYGRKKRGPEQGPMREYADDDVILLARIARRKAHAWQKKEEANA